MRDGARVAVHRCPAGVSRNIDNVVYLKRYIDRTRKVYIVMARTLPSLLPRLSRLLGALGDRLRHARLRRAHTAATVAQRAGISRSTLLRVERGDPAVALGIYARVLEALGLDADLDHLAADDELGRKLQDAGLPKRVRAPRRQHTDLP